MAEENVVKQHRLLVCMMTLDTKKRKIVQADPKDQMVEIEEGRLL